MNRPILGVNFHNWFQDTEQGAVSFAFPTLYGIFGLDFVYFNEGSIIEFNQDFIRSLYRNTNASRRSIINRMTITDLQ